MLSKVQVTPNIWTIYGDRIDEVAKGFIRFQEYYENNELKGKKGVTVRDIELWWCNHCKKNAIEHEQYYTAWTGFNIPGKIILDLLRTPDFRTTSPLTLWSKPYLKEETQFIKLMEDLSVDQINNGYFIGLWKKSTDVLDHELAHAYFSTNIAYRASQTYNISQLPKDIYTGVANQLIEMGYHKDVVHDEIQAYFSTYVNNLAEIFGNNKLVEHTPPFVDVYQKFSTILKVLPS